MRTGDDSPKPEVRSSACAVLSHALPLWPPRHVCGGSYTALQHFLRVQVRPARHATERFLEREQILRQNDRTAERAAVLLDLDLESQDTFQQSCPFTPGSDQH